MTSLATLFVYAYSSFVSSWGPGPELVEKFQAQCQCRVKLVSVGNGGEILSRLKLEGARTKADVIVGIDSHLIGKYKRDLKWSGPFEEFENGPYAFIYNSEVTKSPPRSLDDLLDPKWKGQILLEDPRLSTVGLGFLLWVIQEKKDGAWEYLAKLKPQIKTIAPSWDLAYGLFKKQQGALVFSYWTSPAYHIQEEKTDKYKAAAFPAHPIQKEFMTIVPTTKNKDLSTRFLSFMASPAAQAIIASKNFMYPANPKASLPEAFKNLGTPKSLPPLSEDDVNKIEDWLKKWRMLFS